MTTTKIQILRDALTDEHAWLEAQSKAISKGCGSSWGIGQCDERMGLIDAALRLTEGAQDAPKKIDTEKLATLVQWFVSGDLPEDMFWNVQVTAEVLRRAFPIAHREAVADAPGEAVHQWRSRFTSMWHDTTKEDAYSRVDDIYEARTLYTHPAPTPTAEVATQKASTEPAWGIGHVAKPAYMEEQADKNRRARARLDAVSAHPAAEYAKRAEGATDDRSAFEASDDLSHLRFNWSEARQEYLDFSTHHAWEGWQARGQQQAGVPEDAP